MTATIDDASDRTRDDARDAQRDALAGRLAGAVLATLDLQAVYIGDRLGLYRALEEGGAATAPELAKRAGIHPRYAREWLEHQAVGAILDVDDATAAPDERRYTLPAGHAAVLTDPESPWLLAPLSRFVVGTAATMPRLLDAYRTGGGVDWADYGADVVEAQEGINRPQFHHLMGDWIGALPDIAEMLRSGKGRVADVACGTGWSSISIARHFPDVDVDGIDIDEGSIARAKAHAASAGLDGRVSFLFADAASADGQGRYDLVTIFEALHDMARPAEVLAAARRLLAPGGAVLVGDERVAETFTAPGDEAERLFYGYSVVACLANGLVDQPSVGTGTVIRPSTVEAYAREAGFTGFTILPTQHEAFRFYRLDP
jgi:2-polyprenyl-3-methyl-5-hydroxy-6-metoxy-1,4-benzoquinol methylase